MQRYFVEEKNSQYYLNKGDLHHFSNVMRGCVQDEIVCIYNQMVYQGFVQDLSSGLVSLGDVIEEDCELDVEITLIYALAKGDKFDFVVQKATELGVNKIVPMLSNRCVVKMDQDRFSKKRERYQKIAKEACLQCLRTSIPEVMPLCNIDDVAMYFGDYNLIAYEEVGKGLKHGMLHNVVSKLKTGDKITIIVGSEGGFDQKEVDKLVENGVIACSLGKRILRSETAPLYMLSVLGYSREIINGKS